MQLLLIVYAGINLVVFAIYGVDKFKAVRHAWRIPEKTLLIAAFFGVVGAMLGMLVFRHKIRKPKFYILVPLMAVLEAYGAYMLYTKFM
ncbi:MAG: DUF1294 domain-containing protein [Clostridiales bacterium]|nr:DUF1294 domain-containing protein [Candidatus Blautia equi]